MTKDLKVSLVKLTILSFLLSITLATVVSDYSGSAGDTNPICASPGRFTFDPQNLKAAGAAGIDFDYAFTYFDLNSNSAPLFLKQGSAGPPIVDWKFGTYTNNRFGAYQETTCTGTSGATFVGYSFSILILKDGANYKVCKFDKSNPTTAITPITLNVPPSILTSAITSLVQLSNEYNLYALVSDGTDSAVVKFLHGSLSNPGAIHGTYLN